MLLQTAEMVEKTSDVGEIGVQIRGQDRRRGSDRDANADGWKGGAAAVDGGAAAAAAVRRRFHEGAARE